MKYVGTRWVYLFPVIYTNLSLPYFMDTLGCEIGETGASPPCFFFSFFFSTHLERAFCMLEDSTIHTCKVCTLVIFHSIYGIFWTLYECRRSKDKDHANRADSPRPWASSPIGWGRSALFQKAEKQYMDNQKSTRKHLLFRNRGVIYDKR